MSPIESPRRVTSDGDFIYWLGTRRTGKRRYVSVLRQRSITTGMQRELFATRGYLRGVAAGGGRIAFDVAKPLRGSTAPSFKGSLFTMSATDAHPALLESARTKFFNSSYVITRNGRKLRRPQFTQCGQETSLNDVSELGQILVFRRDTVCSRSGATKVKTVLYPAGSSTAVELPGEDYPITVGHNELITISANGVVVRDLAGGATRILDSSPITEDPALDSVAIDPAGHISLIEEERVSRRKIIKRLLLFAPGAATRSASIPLDPRNDVDLVYCGDALLQVSLTRGTSRLTLRDLNGAVISQLPGPKSYLYAGAKCTGGSALIFTQGKPGISISEYHFR